MRGGSFDVWGRGATEGVRRPEADVSSWRARGAMSRARSVQTNGLTDTRWEEAEPISGSEIDTARGYRLRVPMAYEIHTVYVGENMVRLRLGGLERLVEGWKGRCVSEGGCRLTGLAGTHN